MHTNKKLSGFTIVELLIVIVVIAILAAISVVAYRGIQERANDSAVQNDINSLAKRIALHHAEFENYPTASTASGIAGITMISLAKGSYLTNSSSTNFYYCRGMVSGSPAFAIGAISKSTNRYYSSLNGGVRSYEGAWNTSAEICPGMLPGVSGLSFAQGWNRGDSTWYPWTN